MTNSAGFEVKTAPSSLRGWPGAKEYRKTATVWAVRMPVAFTVETPEGVMQGAAGDYLCEGPAGERWPVKKEIFDATYRDVTDDY